MVQETQIIEILMKDKALLTNSIASRLETYYGLNGITSRQVRPMLRDMEKRGIVKITTSNYRVQLKWRLV